MNYPIPVKKVFTRVRYSAHDIWQNMRALKRNISCLVKNLDCVGDSVLRNRRLLQGIDPQGDTHTDSSISLGGPS